MLVTKQRFAFSFFVFSVFLILLVPNSSDAADVGNCLLCHKYPGLSRIDKDGNLRLLFINEGTFNNSVHAKIKCEGCHADIKKIPHDPVKKVDCLTQCHIQEPTSEQKFSHKEVTTLQHSWQKVYTASLTAREDEKNILKTFLVVRIAMTILYTGPFPSSRGYVPAYLILPWADAGFATRRMTLSLRFITMLPQDCILPEAPKISQKCVAGAMTTLN